MKVVTKHSDVPGKVPVAADLEVGELAVNTNDAKLYTKHSDNSIVDLTQSGTGLTLNKGTATLDFSTGSNEAFVVVTGQTGILSTSVITVYINADDTSSNHTASDHKYFSELCSINAGIAVDNTGFTIYARSIHKLTGSWTVRYTWIN